MASSLKTLTTLTKHSAPPKRKTRSKTRLNPIITISQPLLLLLGRLAQGHEPYDVTILQQHIEQQNTKIHQAITQRYDATIADHVNHVLETAFLTIHPKLLKTTIAPSPHAFEDLTQQLLEHSSPHMELLELVYLCAKNVQAKTTANLPHQEREEQEYAFGQIYQLLRNHQGAYQQTLMTPATSTQAPEASKHHHKLMGLGGMAAVLIFCSTTALYYVANMQASLLNQYLTFWTPKT